MITPTFQINLLESELKFTFICAPGPGGQNVNKVATGVLLRFNLVHSALLADDIKQRLINQVGKKLTASGELIIKASRFRSQAQNKQDARNRLQAMISAAAIPRKKRKKTKPSKASIEKRLYDKKSLALKKSQRRTPGETS